MLIDRFMPPFHVRERHRILVLAPPRRAYAALRRVDLSRSPMISILFGVRGLPRLFAGRAGPRRLTLEDFLRRGFVLLAEEPGIELVLGLIGRFWEPTGGIVRFEQKGFVPFSEAGYAKAAWNFRVEPRGEEGSVVTTETRVLATDGASLRSFRRYWRVVGPFSGLIRGRMLALAKAEAEREG